MTIEKRFLVGSLVLPLIRKEAKVGDEIRATHRQEAKGTSLVADELVYTSTQRVISSSEVQWDAHLEQLVGYVIPIDRGSGSQVLTGNQVNERSNRPRDNRVIRPIFRYKPSK